MSIKDHKGHKGRENVFSVSDLGIRTSDFPREFVSAALLPGLAAVILAWGFWLQSHPVVTQVFAGLMSAMVVPFGVITSRRHRLVPRVSQAEAGYRDLFES